MMRMRPCPAEIYQVLKGELTEVCASRGRKAAGPVAAAVAVGICLGAGLAVGGCQQAGSTAQWSSKDDPALGARSGERGSYESMPPPEMNVSAATWREAFSTGVEQRALAVLERAVGSSNPLLRAHALEALHLAPDEARQPMQQLIVDENPGVRFVAAMTIGRLKFCDLDHLVEPLLDDPSASVRAAAMFALEACGRTINLNPLADMLMSGEPEAMGNAALVLGEMGNPTAIGVLRAAASRGASQAQPARAKVVEMQIAEAMVLLGERSQLDVLRAALFSPPEQAELIALAAQMLGRVGDAKAVHNLQEIAARSGRRQLPAEVRMAAVAALAELDRRRSTTVVPEHYLDDEDYRRRAQAAVTLGAVGDPSSLERLDALLEDPNPLVQVSAAHGILKIADRAFGSQGGKAGNRPSY